jgi:hypothetical protein
VFQNSEVDLWYTKEKIRNECIVYIKYVGIFKKIEKVKFSFFALHILRPKSKKLIFLCKCTRNEYFAYRKQAAKFNFAAVAFNDGR